MYTTEVDMTSLDSSEITALNDDYNGNAALSSQSLHSNISVRSDSEMIIDIAS